MGIIRYLGMMNELTNLSGKIIWHGISYAEKEFLTFVSEKMAGDLLVWERDVYNFVKEWFEKDREYFVVFTSGSTGKPQEIKLSRKAMVQSALATGKFLGLKPKQTALLCLPAKFIAGKMMIVRAFVLDLDMYAIAPKIKLSFPLRQRFDFAAMIPPQVQECFDRKDSFLLENINTLLIGGAAIPTQYMPKIESLENKVYATYGMTETITHIALQRINGKEKSLYFNCLPNVRVLKVNDCLRIKLSHHIEIQTRDLVHIKSPTQFKILGRKDFIINSGGLKINPIEMEEVLKVVVKMPFIITWRKHDFLGQEVVLLIATKSSSVLEKKALLKDISKLTVAVKMPKDIVCIPCLLRTENNKLDRKRNQEYVEGLRVPIDGNNL